MTATISGIDIGSYAAKVVTLSALNGHQADLVDLGLAQLPSDLILNWEDEPAPARTAVSQALKNMAVRNYVEAMTLAGPKPAVLDIDGPALCNAYEFTRPGNRDNAALLDIGAHKLRLVVLRDGVPMIIKEEAGGGQYLTEELAAALGLNLDAAEAVKFGAEQASDPGLAAEAVGRVTAGWIDAVKRALASAREKAPGYRAEALFLSGGGSLISGLAGQFQKHLNIRTELFNPLLNVNFDTEKYDPEYLRYIGPQMAVSFGLALRRADMQ